MIKVKIILPQSGPKSDAISAQIGNEIPAQLEILDAIGTL